MQMYENKTYESESTCKCMRIECMKMKVKVHECMKIKCMKVKVYMHVYGNGMSEIFVTFSNVGEDSYL